ncbi:MAG: HalX domain-containing protein [Haloarculaceae archaeon]
MTEGKPMVLLADDEEPLLELYSVWLDDYDVRTAASGEEVLEQLDDAVSVVLLDRRMHGLNGDEALETIRDRGLDCRVAIVSAVEPDVDDATLGFDEYVVKPTTRTELTEVVETLDRVGDLDPEAREYFRLAAKRAVLERSVPEHELDASEAYGQIRDRLEALDDAGRRLATAFDDDDRFVDRWPADSTETAERGG